jgi:hypothetical protein
MKKLIISVLVASVVLGGLVSSSVALAGVTVRPFSAVVSNNDHTSGHVVVTFTDVQAIPSKNSNIYAVHVNQNEFTAYYGGDPVTTPPGEVFAVLLNAEGVPIQNFSGQLQISFTADFINTSPQPQPPVSGTIGVTVVPFPGGSQFTFLPEQHFFNSNHTAACGILADNNGPSPAQPELVLSCVTLYGKSK